MSSTDNFGAAPMEGCPLARGTAHGGDSNTGSFLPVPDFSLSDIMGLPGLNRRQRRRLLRDCNEAVFGLNWLHGTPFWPVYGPGQSRSTQARIRHLHRDVQQRILEAACFWLDVDSAVSEEGAYEELLKGKAGYSTAGLTTMAPYKYSSVSLPEGCRTHLS